MNNKRYNDPTIHGVRRANNILITPSEFSSGIRPYKSHENDEEWIGEEQLKILSTSKES